MSTSKIYQTLRGLKNMRPFAQILACYRATPIFRSRRPDQFLFGKKREAHLSIFGRLRAFHVVKCTNLKSIGDRNVVEFRLGKNCIQNQMYLYQVPWPEFISSKICSASTKMCWSKPPVVYLPIALLLWLGTFDTPNSVHRSLPFTPASQKTYRTKLANRKNPAKHKVAGFCCIIELSILLRFEVLRDNGGW